MHKSLRRCVGNWDNSCCCNCRHRFQHREHVPVKAMPALCGFQRASAVRTENESCYECRAGETGTIAAPTLSTKSLSWHHSSSVAQNALQLADRTAERLVRGSEIKWRCSADRSEIRGGPSLTPTPVGAGWTAPGTRAGRRNVAHTCPRTVLTPATRNTLLVTAASTAAALLYRPRYWRSGKTSRFWGRQFKFIYDLYR